MPAGAVVMMPVGVVTVFGGRERVDVRPEGMVSGGVVAVGVAGYGRLTQQQTRQQQQRHDPAVHSVPSLATSKQSITPTRYRRDAIPCLSANERAVQHPRRLNAALTSFSHRRPALTAFNKAHPAAGEAFRDAIVSDLVPVGAAETDLAERVAMLTLLLRRVSAFETAVVTQQSDEAAQLVKKGTPIGVSARPNTRPLRTPPPNGGIEVRGRVWLSGRASAAPASIPGVFSPRSGPPAGRRR